MKFPRDLKFVPFTLAVLAGNVVANAQAEPEKITTTTTRVVEATYLPGSKEVRQIQQWLLLHADPTGKMAGNPRNLGTVTVKYTDVIVAKGKAAIDVAAPPPVPFPSTGVPGGTFSVSTCGGGEAQSWTYAWVPNSSGGSWVPTDYHTYRAPACSSNNSGQ
ncbi:hypothetical protein [Xanthomonas albilineans]|uniref:hypothetical protein n=1 Tax=Xanthomonas albilineans TaxID=29447 RepID=UPI0006990A93|nr:hypothetical protein [Xanthomonas albilineans]